MSIPLPDAWVLARLLPDLAVNGELALLSAPWKAIAERLAAAPLEDRARLWDAATAALPDRDAINLAVANVDPEGPQPPPEATIEAVDSWGPLRIYDPPSVESFPLDVLPPAVADLASEGAKSIGCPADFIAGACLAVAAGAVGRSASLMLKSGYFASSSLYIAVVGPPGDGKSPALDIADEPVRKLGEQFARDHADAMERWRKERDARDKKSGEPEPPQPVATRVDVGDVTTERLIGLFSENPRGLVMVRDELASLFGGMDQYRSGKGADRQFYCGVWSGASQQRDRIGKFLPESMRCDHPCLSIVGGMTPDLLGAIGDAQGRADGLQDRVLFVYPEPRPVAGWSSDGVSPAVKDRWTAVVDRLWLRQSTVSSEGVEHPRVTRMTRQAEVAWARLYQGHSDEMNDPGFPPSLRGPWAKLKEYAGRLALVLCLMDHAADPTADVSIVPDATERHIENAWRLIAYFKSHARRVHAAVNLGVAGPEAVAAKAVVLWLRDGGRDTFTESHVKQARRWIEPDALAKALAYLAKSNAIRPQEATQGSAKGGRPPSPVYDVNPALLATRNPDNPVNP